MTQPARPRRAARLPVTERFHGRCWIEIAGRRHATPLALAAIVFADLAFAIDSIPAAFAITRDPLLIWMANIFALLGLRALFVLVQALPRRLRYMDQTIAAVLAAVALKLLAADLVQIRPDADQFFDSPPWSAASR